jgi:hypothetical protein
MGGGEPSWKAERREKEKQAQIDAQITPPSEYGEWTVAKGESGPGSVQYQEGTVTGPSDDPSCHNQALRTFSPPDKQMVGIAKQVLEDVREMLPRGPFNNFGGLSDTVREKQCVPISNPDDPDGPGRMVHVPGWWNQVVDVVAGTAVEQLKETMPEVPEFMLSAACLARATREVGGGVCSKMATLTAGILSTRLPPGSEIAQVFHKADHEFVVAKLPDSRWFVVDPWCHEPTVVPFVDCLFDPEGVTKFISMKVTKTAPEGEPFGIDVTGVDWGDTVSKVYQDLEITTTNMAHQFGQESNVGDQSLFDVGLTSVGKDDWGPRDSV